MCAEVFKLLLWFSSFRCLLTCLCVFGLGSAVSALPQPIDYEGFQLFMATYLENDIPEDLCQHLFTSFKSKTGGGCSPEVPRAGVSLLGK